jgi:hypothetical protein
MDKEALVRLKEEVSRILFEVWDPIGVCDGEDHLEDDDEDVKLTLANLRSEYENYEDRVASAIVRGASESELAEMLDDIANRLMGLSSSYATERAAIGAKALAEIKL